MVDKIPDRGLDSSDVFVITGDCEDSVRCGETAE
jgi:hypothetical protein